MFRLVFVFVFLIILCFFLQTRANNTFFIVTSSFTTTYSAANSSAITSKTTVLIQPSTSTARVTASTTEPSSLSAGSQEAVVLLVEKMTIVQFEDKRSEFTATLRTVVEDFCSKPSQSCRKSSRKRRVASSCHVHILPGYPKQSANAESDLLVAVYVSTAESTVLSRNVLFNIVQDYKGNLSASLGRNITGVARVNFFTKPTPTSGVSEKTKILAIFFGVFAGLVVILAVIVAVTCWIGSKSERDDIVRPLTTSNLELVDNPHYK